MSADQLELVSGALGLQVPDELVSAICLHPIVGLDFSLDEKHDESGMGVEMRVMTASQIIDEGAESQPGITASCAGYLPIGMCLEGSGDPYFLNTRNGALVRIYHDLDPSSELGPDSVDSVVCGITEFLRLASVNPR